MEKNNYFINGITDLIILYFLRQKDCYGYEMTKAVSDLSEGLLSIPVNTIYTAIYKLEGEGLISEYSKLVGKRRTRVYYKLEASGEKYLDKLLSVYHSTFAGVENILGKRIGEVGNDEIIKE